MKLAVASGKGGTGKTTISVNLARVLQSDVHLLDCDVEEPNCHLFLKTRKLKEEVVNIPVPDIDPELCNGCGECGKVCEFHAIVSFGSVPLVFPDMCHGCGGCIKACLQKAITESDKKIGVVTTSQMDRITLVQGLLDVGVAMAPPLIRAVKSRINKDGLTILDAPPGTSCPVIATIRGSDFVILVTEPTPFGLNDLVLAVEMVRVLNIPFGVVINREGMGDDRVEVYCTQEKIPILARIPDARKIAEAYSQGDLIVDVFPEYLQIFQQLLKTVQRHVNIEKGAIYSDE